MSLSSLIAKGIGIANKQTASLQAQVSFQAWVSQDEEGAPKYAAPILIPALVEPKVKHMIGKDGQMVLTKAQITFLVPLPPNGAKGRVEPIDSRDIIVLPNGTTGSIMLVEGLVNPDTSQPYMSQVTIG